VRRPVSGSRVNGFSLSVRAYGAVAAARHSHLLIAEIPRSEVQVLPLFLLSPPTVYGNLYYAETMKLSAETLLTPDCQYHGRSADS
jgi:hypothetical protein